MDTSALPPAPPAAIVERDVERSLSEDIGAGDATADLLPAGRCANARLLCREPAVVAGSAWFDACFRRLDPGVHIDWRVNDSDRVVADTVLCRLRGNARALVSAERSALNFLQTLSATATVTARYVDAIAGTGARVLDTRKTLPGLRIAQKYAVRCGGGDNHRAGLFDAMLIKENHIIAAGSIAEAVRVARMHHPDLLLEVEVESLDELSEALAMQVDRILLDEFTPTMLVEAVRRTAARVPLEVSGSVDLERIRAIAETGVDFISVGALTKHVHAIDLSLRLELD
jgi:nicotinate-nucleotide pyrophosphorylase (carboxylating)